MSKFTIGFLALILVIAFAGSALAQVPKPLSFGVKAGLSVANFTGDDMDDWDPRIGVAAGAFAKINAIPGLTLQPELMFVQKGGTWEEDTILGKTELDLKMDYIDFALLVRKGFPTPALAPYVLAGPVINYISSAESETTTPLGSDTTDFKDEVKSTTWGFMVGAGVQLGNMLGEIRYEVGMGEWDDTGNVDAKIDTITLLVGASF